MKPLSEFHFANELVDHLPGESSMLRQSRAVLNSCYSLINPEPVILPKLLAWSENLAETLGVERPPTTKDSGQRESNLFSLDLLAGNYLVSSMKPYAACYGGHQFGRWAGQLGDGRAITLGEIQDLQGKTWELQLKGAGATPFSRFADGRAVLRSSLREYVASEAMFHLGVPTTRALSLVGTGEAVVRDMFYDGNAAPESGAIVARLAPSFLRFGSFEIHSARGDYQTLKALLDWTIRKHFPEFQGENSTKYALWFREVAQRTARLMVEWERVGFVHGVMNTDNMSVLGLSIDFGPYGWMDHYDPLWTPNTTDLPGRRYAFGRQSSIALWNLECLASAIAPLLPSHDPLQEGLQHYLAEYREQSRQTALNKLGLQKISVEESRILVGDLINLFTQTEVDMTIFYRRLGDLVGVLSGPESALLWDRQWSLLADAFYQPLTAEVENSLKAWLAKYSQALCEDSRAPEERRETMNRVNPKFIPRNYLLFEVIEDLEKNDTRSLEAFMTVLKSPYEEHPGFEMWAERRPDWARSTPGCSTLSCSS